MAWKKQASDRCKDDGDGVDEDDGDDGDDGDEDGVGYIGHGHHAPLLEGEPHSLLAGS